MCQNDITKINFGVEDCLFSVRQGLLRPGMALAQILTMSFASHFIDLFTPKENNFYYVYQCTFLFVLVFQNIRVNDDFEKVLFTINDQNEESQLRVVHAGLHRDQYNITFSDEDPRDTFERDPMTKLKR